MEKCERCERVFDMKQDEGDYRYWVSENDQTAHAFCNSCLEEHEYSCDNGGNQ